MSSRSLIEVGAKSSAHIQPGCDRAAYLCDLAISSARIGHLADAEDYLKAATLCIESGSSPIVGASARISIARAWNICGNLALAIENCQRADEILSAESGPSISVPLAMLGMCYARVGSRSHAHTIAARIVQQAQESVDFTLGFGLGLACRVHVLVEDFGEADKLLRKISSDARLALQCAAFDLFPDSISSGSVRRRADWIESAGRLWPEVGCTLMRWYALQGQPEKVLQLWRRLANAVKHEESRESWLGAVSLACLALRKSMCAAEAQELLSEINACTVRINRSELSAATRGRLARVCTAFGQLENANMLRFPSEDSTLEGVAGEMTAQFAEDKDVDGVIAVIRSESGGRRHRLIVRCVVELTISGCFPSEGQLRALRSIAEER